MKQNHMIWTNNHKEQPSIPQSTGYGQMGFKKKDWSLVYALSCAHRVGVYNDTTNPYVKWHMYTTYYLPSSTNYYTISPNLFETILDVHY